MSTRELQSTIKAMVAKKGVVETSKKIGVTTVSLQAFLHGSEVYAKTLAKMQKAAGVEVTAIPAKEKVKLAAEEKRAVRKAKKAARLEKAKAKAAGKPAKKKIKAKPAKAKVKSKTPAVKKSKKKSLKARAKLAAKSLKKKKHTTKPTAASTNGVAGPTVAAEEHDESENAGAVAEAS